MRWTSRVTCFVTAVGALAASLGGQSVPTSASASDIRVFGFIARYRGGQPWEGTFVIYKDSAVVSPRIGQCGSSEPSGKSSATEVFKCEGLTGVDNLFIAIDRQSPARSAWRGTVQKATQRPTTECIKPATDATGKPTGGCAKYGSETVYTDEIVTGRLEILAK